MKFLRIKALIVILNEHLQFFISVCIYIMSGSSISMN